ncbi:MAG: hypothetical protein DSZ05_01780 [Sulfurospirillum sp.]|nr:MAG: hypothetical protein DSZ05_01780 [Sulfurospirillum sp.]
MFTAIKKQMRDYQSWLDIATDIDLSPYRVINRFDITTFVFVFFAMLFGYFLTLPFHPNLTLFALILHIALGINILKARAIVANALEKLESDQQLNDKVAQFLNRQYSLFLVSQGKNPLTQKQIESLEVHKAHFTGGMITRSGRGDSIKRFRKAFLKREKMFFNILFAILVVTELFIVF